MMLISLVHRRPWLIWPLLPVSTVLVAAGSCWRGRPEPLRLERTDARGRP